MTAQGEQATDKLYWVASLAYDQTGFNVGSLGWCEPDGSNSQGAWKLDGDGYYSKVWAHYALEINNTWAAANTSGKTLGVGKIMNNGSRGPSLFATAPWLDNNGAPLADQGVMAHKTLMYFPFEHPINIWSGASNVTGNDGAWITIGDKQAFVVLWGVTYASEMGYWWKSITPSTSVTYDARCGEFVSTSAMTTDSMTVSVNDASNWPTRGTMRIGSEYMKYSSRTGSTLSISERGVQGSTIEAHNSGSYAQLYTQDSVDYTGSIQESNGNIGLVKFPILLFFDVDQLAEVAAGTRQSYDMAPYAMLNLNDFFHESEARNNGGYRPATTYGMAYDPVENRLIISERLYTLGWEPLYHVVELNDVGTTLDTATPSAPTGVSVNGSGVISWSGDANGDYVIFKYYPQGICTADTVEYRPIASIRGTSWTDPLYQVGDLYAVRAMSDAMIQSGYAYSSIRNAEIKSSGTISSFGASGTAVSIRQ
jgi:hypothetical protein